MQFFCFKLDFLHAFEVYLPRIGALSLTVETSNGIVGV